MVYAWLVRVLAHFMSEDVSYDVESKEKSRVSFCNSDTSAEPIPASLFAVSPSEKIVSLKSKGILL